MRNDVREILKRAREDTRSYAGRDSVDREEALTETIPAFRTGRDALLEVGGVTIPVFLVDYSEVDGDDEVS